ncbi:MAG: hypothetical protein ACXWW4_05330 [Candidatus Binatia bacterium]
MLLQLGFSVGDHLALFRAHGRGEIDPAFFLGELDGLVVGCVDSRRARTGAIRKIIRKTFLGALIFDAKAR